MNTTSTFTNRLIAVGAVNSAGDPVVLITNDTDTERTINVKMQKTTLYGSMTASVYMASAVNDAGEPVTQLRTNVVGDLSLTLDMPALSVAGIRVH